MAAMAADGAAQAINLTGLTLKGEMDMALRIGQYRFVTTNHCYYSVDPAFSVLQRLPDVFGTYLGSPAVSALCSAAVMTGVAAGSIVYIKPVSHIVILLSPHLTWSHVLSPIPTVAALIFLVLLRHYSYLVCCTLLACLLTPRILQTTMIPFSVLDNMAIVAMQSSI